MDAVDKKDVWKLRMLVGFVSFVMGQVLLGQCGIYWFIRMDMLFIILPIYVIQSSLLLTFAIKLRRVGFGHLYLWGCLFGSFDLWLSAWRGNQGGLQLIMPLGGPPDFGVFGLYEALFLIFFWHPLFSFILPLAVSLRLLTQHPEDFVELFPGIVPLTQKKPVTWIMWCVSAVVATALFTYHVGSDPETSFLPEVFTFILTSLVFAFIWLAIDSTVVRAMMKPATLYTVFIWDTRDQKAGSIVLAVLYASVIMRTHNGIFADDSLWPLWPELVAFSVIGVLFMVLLAKPTRVQLDENGLFEKLVLQGQITGGIRHAESKHFKPNFYISLFGAIVIVVLVSNLLIAIVVGEQYTYDTNPEIVRFHAVFAWMVLMISVFTFLYAVLFADEFFTYPTANDPQIE